MQPPADQSNATTTFKFETEQKRLRELMADWGTNEKQAIEDRRLVRRFANNTESLQKTGQLAADEVLIPRRVVDNNIGREKPNYVAYIEQSVRLVLFKDVADPKRTTTPLADWFAAGMRYEGWNTEWHAVIDGTLLHGGSFIEVRFDESKPFNIALEAVGRDDLIFATKTRRSIQRNERLLKRYEYLPHELEEAVAAHGFSATEVKRLTEKATEANREVPIEVYRAFIKKQGMIYVAWYSESCQDWLKAPELLDLGFRDEAGLPLPVSLFPFFWNAYEIIEDEHLLAVKGRAARDLADQDALTQLWSSVVNGANNASALWASRKLNPANPEGDNATVIQRGKASASELNFHNMPYPDPMILTVAQALSTENMASIGQVDFAVNNRQDSRKTAREISSATKQAGLLSSVKIVPFANTVREVYGFVWLLVQAQVQAGAIVPPDDLRPYFKRIYSVASAGDVEVIQKAEKLQSMQMFYPVIAQTPLGPLMLTRMIEMQFPEEAAQWTQALQASDLKPIVAQLLQIITNIPPEVIPPQAWQAMKAITANASSVLQQSASMGGGSPQLAGINPNPATNSQSPEEA